MKSFDVIVVGLGAMGSAACYQLAKRGLTVLGLDQYEVPHNLGSSHGESRVMRLAIGEGEHYTPMALRSYELFREIEQLSASSLLKRTGMLTISSQDKGRIESEANFFDNTTRAANKFGIKHEILEPQEVRLRFPQFAINDDERAYFEYEAGYLQPEECIKAQLLLASQFGANISTPETLLSFTEERNTIAVKTSRASYQAKHLVLAAGPWLPTLMPQQMQQSFKIYRMSLSWFDVGQCYEQFSLDAGFPVFFWQLPGFDKWIYGFPAIDGPTGGLKVAATDDFSPISVDKVCRQVSEEEVERAYRTYISPCLPALGGPLRSSTCLITATPDSEFVIDYVPGSSRVLLVSACSGHGFKHSAAVGECIGSLIKDGRSAIDISHFSLQRLFSEDRDPSA